MVTPSNSTTAPVQGADNPVLGSILRSDYTTASEAAAGRLAAAAGARQEVDVARTSIATRINELTAQKEMLAAQKVQRQQVVAGARAQVAQITGTKQTLNIGGQKVVLDRVGITKALQAATKEEAKLRRNLERSIAQAVGDIKVGGAGSIKGAETKLLRYEDRLQVLFEQAKTLKQWSDSTGNALRNELAAVGQAMLDMPARGEAGVAAREWVRSVQRSVESTKFIKDKTVKAAYERVTQLLHVGEIGMAQAEDAVSANKELIDIVKAGRFGAVMGTR